MNSEDTVPWQAKTIHTKDDQMRWKKDDDDNDIEVTQRTGRTVGQAAQTSSAMDLCRSKTSTVQWK